MKHTNILILSIRVLLVATCIGAFARGILATVIGEMVGTYYMAAFTAIISLGITYVPDFLRNNDIMMVPMALQTVFTIFAFCAMFLGEILHFYDRFFWWDTVLHFFSGFMLGLVGFMLSASLNRNNEIHNLLNPVSIVLFCICFALAGGAIWEIFEFTGDSMFGMNMQRWQSSLSSEQWMALQNVSNMSNPGLTDTMKDIINDTVGALISIPIIVYFTKRDNKNLKAKITAKELLIDSEKAIWRKNN